MTRPAITPSRPNGLPSPETIAKFSKLIPVAPLSKDNRSTNYAAVSMRKLRQHAKDAIGQPGQVVRFKWGNSGRTKTGTIVKINHNATIVTVHCKKRGGNHSVPASQIVKMF